MIETGFTFELSTEDLRNFKTDEPLFDLIYFDAFALLHSPSYGQKMYFKPFTMLIAEVLCYLLCQAR